MNVIWTYTFSMLSLSCDNNINIHKSYPTFMSTVNSDKFHLAHNVIHLLVL